MKTFKQFITEMKEIKFKNETLTWNPNKTELDWKKRIKDRTNLSEIEFYQVIQKGINSVDLPIDVAICLYFIKSKFVLILNTKNKIITTIRDGKWDKPGNNCKHFKITNEDLTNDDELIKILNNHSTDCWLWEVNSDFDLEITHNCNYCFKVDL